VPWGFGWGTRDSSGEKGWYERTFGDAKFANWMIESKQWYFITAAGTRPRGTNRPEKLEEILDAFSRLPEAERKPNLPQGDVKRGGVFAPPGGLVISTYCRALAPKGAGEFTQARGVDLTEFGGKQEVTSDYFREPQRQDLWLTEEEWKSLIPSGASKGAVLEVPRPISRRIFHYYLENNVATCGSWWYTGDFREGELKLTVEEVASGVVRMRLDGSALMSHILGDEFSFYPEQQGQKGLPKRCERSADMRIVGKVEYDSKKKAITRFDAVALGDYRGNWYNSFKAEPLPFGVAFELDPQEYTLPLERRRPLPFGLFASYHFANGGQGAPPYWDPSDPNAKRN